MFVMLDRKKKDFRLMSNKKCIDCGKPLKQNLIDKNPDAERCYKCHKPKPTVKNTECTDCNGTGDEIDRSKVTCRSIDIPYKACTECGGSGQRNN